MVWTSLTHTRAFALRSLRLAVSVDVVDQVDGLPGLPHYVNMCWSASYPSTLCVVLDSLREDLKTDPLDPLHPLPVTSKHGGEANRMVARRRAVSGERCQP
jgi:hypothetical protein